MSDEHDHDDGGDGDGGGFWSQFPNWLKIVAGVLTGAAALFAAVPPLLNALGITTPSVKATSAQIRYIVIPTNDHFLALREFPTASSTLILKMETGSVVSCGPVLDEHPSWRACGFAGRTGYANTTYLRKLDS